MLRGDVQWTLGSAVTSESRRLAAIVAVDVVGFSALVASDEEGILRDFRAHRQEFIDPLIKEHQGRIANTAGDSLLLEFPSVVNAVRCAASLQNGMAARNHDIDPDRRIRLRIGVNLGDVVGDGNDLLGDGVNIAARLEGACEPGGIAISDDAYRQVRDKLDLPWTNGGEHQLKNIPRPVRIWRWAGGALRPGSSFGRAADSGQPSIAVLAFDNMSGDPDQEYFSDGIAEDLITSLSKLRWLFVIARNSSFAYKGTAVNVRQAGRELGVRYVLEGSVRKAGDRVRITAQLAETEAGNHLWAERYDRDLRDVFVVQDEITTKIVSALDPAIRNFEAHAAMAKQPESLEAWDHLLRGLSLRNRFRRESNLAARSEFVRATALDPGYARAHAWLATTYLDEAMLDWTDDRSAALDRARRHALQARSLDDGDALCHAVVAAHCFWISRLPQGRQSAERAIQLNPNSFQAHYVMGGLLNYLGEPAASREASETALRLSPNEPISWHCMGSLAHAHYNLKDYERTVEVADRAIATRYGYLFGRVLRTAALGQMGRADWAGQSLAEITDRLPDFSPAAFDYYPFVIEEQRRHLIEGLRKAGLRD